MVSTTNHNQYGDIQELFSTSSDLVQLARDHISFLQGLHEHNITLTKPSTESVRRYHSLWLPLVQKFPNEPLIPPADVAWLWHCHRLAPFRYTKYCKQTFGSVLEANPPFSAQFVDNNAVYNTCSSNRGDTANRIIARTVTLWTKHYPTESFHVVDITINQKKQKKTKSTKTTPSLLLDGYDVIAAAERQSTFLWQISAPTYSQDSFLHDGVVNYYKFLCLKRTDNHVLSPQQQQDKDLVIVPTYQIDLLWHTHILASTKSYYEDCITIIGTPLYHDDSTDDDRSEGGFLDTAFRATQAAWYKCYQEEYHVVGGMYRGEPPQEFYSPSFVHQYKQMLQLYYEDCGCSKAMKSPSSSSKSTHHKKHKTTKKTKKHHKHCNKGAVAPEPIPVVEAQLVSGTYPAAQTTTPPTRQETFAWTDLDGSAPDGKVAYLPPEEGTQLRSRPRKTDYIFGDGPKGQGFYHITTREAYYILDREINRKKHQVASDIAMAKGCCGVSKKEKALIPAKERELSQLDLTRKIVSARVSSDRRNGTAGLSGIPESSTIFKEYYSPEGVWYFPVDLYKYGSPYKAPQPPATRGRVYESSSRTYVNRYRGGFSPVGAGFIGGGIGLGTGVAIGLAAANCGGFGGCGGFAGCGGGACGGFGGCGGGACGGGGCGGGGCGGF